MALKDFFGRIGNKDNSSKKADEPSYDIQYYSNSSQCDMNISISDELIEINGKRLAKGVVSYGNDKLNPGEARVLSNIIYMEPSLTKSENGDVINTTKDYYKQLYQENRSLCKAFFRKQDIQSSPTKYIGSLGLDSYGRYNGTRYKDENFEKEYIQLLETEKNNERNHVRNFQEELTAQTVIKSDNDAYQTMCNNFDTRMNAKEVNKAKKENENLSI